MPKNKKGFLIDDEPVIANSTEEWFNKMLLKAGIEKNKVVTINWANRLE